MRRWGCGVSIFDRDGVGRSFPSSPLLFTCYYRFGWGMVFFRDLLTSTKHSDNLSLSGSAHRITQKIGLDQLVESGLAGSGPPNSLVRLRQDNFFFMFHRVDILKGKAQWELHQEARESIRMKILKTTFAHLARKLWLVDGRKYNLMHWNMWSIMPALHNINLESLPIEM